jgi:acetolactate synthase I/II/III large subunit
VQSDNDNHLLTGGAAIVEALLANGVDTLFGIPGAQMYPFFDALQQNAERIRTYGARHEQTCGYMAFGYARSTGKPGIFSVVPGPGILNAGAALVTALGCNTPVLCITGQIPSAYIGKGRGHLHEIPDQLATLKGLTKWAARIERVEDAAEIINEAFRQMLSGKPGPVAVEMAWDVMLSKASVPPAVRAIIPPPEAPASEQIAAAVALIAKAKRPMIMTGSGAQHASAEVRALSDLLAAPSFALRGGRGVVAEDDTLGISSYQAHQLWNETDLLIGIGSRLEAPYMRWTGYLNFVDRPVAPPQLLRIDIDPEEMNRLVPHAGVVADAAIGVRALIDALKKRSEPIADSARSTIEKRVTEIKTLTDIAIQKVQPQMSYLDVIRDVLPRHGIFVGELTQVGFTSYFGYKVLEPRTYISEGYQGTLGYGFPSALGVKVAHPETPVVSITGDGGFMFAAQELATAVQENIPLVTLLFNNKAYGNVLRDQQTNFGNRIIGATLQNPDFMLLAKAFGVEAHRVNSPETLRPCLAKALASKQPVLIEIDVTGVSEVSPWEFIVPKPEG